MSNIIESRRTFKIAFNLKVGFDVHPISHLRHTLNISRVILRKVIHLMVSTIVTKILK